MHDPNARFDYFARLTPKELESYVITPNMNAILWAPEKFDVLARARTTCENVEDATKKILNNAVQFATKLDPAGNTKPMDEVDNGVDFPLPQLLFRSRLLGINQDERDVFYLHRKGSCVGDCAMHTKSPFNLTYGFFDNQSHVLENWCDTHNECDGFTHELSTNHWYPWSFIDGYREYNGKESYVKASSLQDDCSGFVSSHLFQPTPTNTSEYFVPGVSQSVVVSDNTIEMTKQRSGSLHFDGWSDSLDLQSAGRLYVSGSTVPSNPLPFAPSLSRTKKS
jgi:hypothetical protein